MSRAARAALAAGLLVLASCGSLALAEWIFRLFERHFLIEQIHLDGSQFDLKRYAFNDPEGWLTREKRPGEYRILSFGDSFAESATRAAYSYAAVVQRDLGAADPGHPVRVVNFGRSKTTFPDYLAEHDFWASRVDHDAVLFNLYMGNDFHELPRGSVFLPGQPRHYRAGGEERTLRLGPGVDVPHHTPSRMLDYLQAYYYSWRYAAEPTPEEAELYRGRGVQAPPGPYARTQARMLPLYRPDRLEEAYGDGLYWLYRLLAAARVLQESGVRVAVTIAPPHFVVSPQWRRIVLALEGVPEDAVDPGLPGAIVASLARRAGFDGPIVDFTQCLRAAEGSGEDDLYWRTNTHWSVRGNAVVGHLLAERIAADWLPDHPYTWADRPPGCDTAPRAATPREQAFVAERYAEITAALELQQLALTPLVGRRFRRLPDLEAALGGIGLHAEPERIRGELTALAAGPPGSASASARGWAQDASGAGSLLVIGFDNGRLAGAGLVAPPAASGEPPRFRLRLSNVLVRARWEQAIWAIAVSRDGAWGPVAVEIHNARRPRERKGKSADSESRPARSEPQASEAPTD